MPLDFGESGGAGLLPDKHVTITCASPNTYVRADPGSGPPKVVAGFGRMESVSRPQRRALTRWTGSDPVSLEVPILLDGFRENRSVEKQVTDLERLAGIEGKGEPSRIKITGTGELVPWAGSHEWYITGIDYGDEILSAGGNRVRVELTLTITAAVDAETEKSIAKKNAGKGTHARRYRVKQGDTLRSISRRVLGTPDRWIEIRRLNGISDPRIVGTAGRRKGQTGTVLAMPK